MGRVSLSSGSCKTCNRQSVDLFTFNGSSILATSAGKVCLQQCSMAAVTNRRLTST
jgi:hypothetical protein